MLAAQIANAKPGFFAKGRIESRVPSNPVRLGELTEIPLVLHVPGITELSVSQKSFDVPTQDSDRPRESRIITDSIQRVPILYHPDGSPYIKIRPLNVGQLEVEIGGRYPDGGVVKDSVSLDVKLPLAEPIGLIVGHVTGRPVNYPLLLTRMVPGKEGHPDRFPIGAKYENVNDAVPIDPSLISFDVRTANDRPVIDFDKVTGYYKPLQEGEALVQSRFGGWTNLTCVVVEGLADLNPRKFDNCRSLLLPGERLATPTRDDGSRLD
jgi:hypothetical protein